MSTLLLVPLEDAVVFPNMNLTLPIEAGTDDERVVVVPVHEGEYASVGTVAEVVERVRLPGGVRATTLSGLVAKLQDPALATFGGRVSDSGEGRWTIKAAIDEAVPTPVLSAALFERFSSRGEADFANKLLSALRFEFGGHLEKAAKP